MVTLDQSRILDQPYVELRRKKWSYSIEIKLSNSYQRYSLINK